MRADYLVDYLVVNWVDCLVLCLVDQSAAKVTIIRDK